jgi:hypothetical protein
MTTNSQGLLCAYCHSALDRNTAPLCSECRAAHHEECWEENGGCAVLGCLAAPAIETPATAPSYSTPEWQPAAAPVAEQYQQYQQHQQAQEQAPAIAPGPVSGATSAYPMGPAGWYEIPGQGWLYGVPWLFASPPPPAPQPYNGSAGGAW